MILVIASNWNAVYIRKMGAFLVIASAFGFSTLGIFGKLAYELGLGRNEMLAWRFGLSLPFLFLILLKANALPTRSGPFLRAVGLGAIGIGLEASLYFLTLERLGAALTGVFLYLYPAFVALISHFFLQQRMSGKKWACIALSLFGCVLTVDLSRVQIEGAAGVAFGVMTGLWYAVYLLVADRFTRDENPLMIGSGVVLGASFAFIILSLIGNDSFTLPTGSASWGVLFGMAILASVVPFTALYAGMKRIGPTQTAILSTLEMVFTIILAAAFLGEKLTQVQMFGAFLILLSVLLIQKVR
jgi:drug/metabolite transporter (DMT)-like permease